MTRRRAAERSTATVPMAGSTSSLAIWLLAALAVLCNAGAQVLIKHASSSAADATAGATHLWGLNPVALAAALALYGLSFVVTAWVYARLPLSVASPLMAGAIFVLISMASVFWFAETLTALRVAGMVCIVVGVVLLARST